MATSTNWFFRAALSAVFAALTDFSLPDS